MNRQERRTAARKSGSTPKSPAAATPGSLYELGFAHLRNGRPIDAQVCYQQALVIDPGDKDAAHQCYEKRGHLQHGLKRYEEASRGVEEGAPFAISPRTRMQLK